MVIGAALVGIHMAMTHGVTLAMMSSYIPTTEIEGIGKISGTCWSFTDFVFGKHPPFCPVMTAVCISEKSGTNWSFIIFLIWHPVAAINLIMNNFSLVGTPLNYE